MLKPSEKAGETEAGLQKWSCLAAAAKVVSVEGVIVMRRSPLWQLLGQWRAGAVVAGAHVGRGMEMALMTAMALAMLWVSRRLPLFVTKA